MAQDAFLAAFERIAEFRGEGAFQAWVKRIAARLCIRRFRRAARIDFAAETPEPEPVTGELDAGMRLDLEEALRSLPTQERMCVSLCFGAGFSHAEAAQLLNTPLGTVKSHVKRGLDRLRGRLQASAEAGRRVNE